MTKFKVLIGCPGCSSTGKWRFAYCKCKECKRQSKTTSVRKCKVCNGQKKITLTKYYRLLGKDPKNILDFERKITLRNA